MPNKIEVFCQTQKRLKVHVLRLFGKKASVGLNRSLLIPWSPRFCFQAYQWRPVEETQQVSQTGSAASYSGLACTSMLFVMYHSNSKKSAGQW